MTESARRVRVSVGVSVGSASMVVSVLAMVALGTLPAPANAQEEPFVRRFVLTPKTEGNRLVAGRDFRIRDLARPEGVAVKNEMERPIVPFLVWAPRQHSGGEPVDVAYVPVRYYRPSDEPSTLVLRIPEWDRLQATMDLPYWPSLFQANRLQLCLFESTSLSPAVKSGWGRAPAGTPCMGVQKAVPNWDASLADVMPVELAHRYAALTHGLASVVLACVIVWLLAVPWRRRRHLRHPFLPLLDAIREPGGAFSLARLQMLIWTVVVAAGAVFVWKLEEQLVSISQQALVLLGMGGGTLLTREVIVRRGGPGGLSAANDGASHSLWEIVSAEGRLDLSRCQMLFFTLLLAGTVAKEIWEHSRFPDMDGGLLTLMGISSSTYVLASYVRTDRPTEKTGPAAPPEGTAGGPTQEENPNTPMQPGSPSG